jgi:hypothetical protein
LKGARWQRNAAGSNTKRRKTDNKTRKKERREREGGKRRKRQRRKGSTRGEADMGLEAAICYAEWARDEQRAPPETPPLRVDESRPGPLGEDTSEQMDVGAG